MIEKRLSGSVAAKQRRLTGYAARFNSPTRIGTFTEEIAAGAFARSLADGSDVVALIDHDVSALLGRTRSGTLRLREDQQGLSFELDVPDTQAGRDTLALAERGDLSGMSFGFRVRPGGEQWNADRTHRTLTDVELVEVSVAQAHAAYTSTSVQARTVLPEIESDPWQIIVRLMEMEAGQ